VWAKAIAFIIRERFMMEEIAKWKLVHGDASKSHNGSGTKSMAFLTMDDDVVT
jgi:hypothetical protein